MSIPKRIQTSVVDILTATLIATLVAVAPASLCAQQNVAAQSAVAKAKPQMDEDEAAPSQKPGGEGIKVHGHWIIDVKDKDGKLVERRDFHNALFAGTGTSILISTLVGQRVPNSLSILLFDSQSKPYYIYPPTTSTLIPLTASAYCNVVVVPTCNPNLVTTLHQTTNGYDSIILSGSFTPATAISVVNVQTIANACQTQDNTTITLTPAQCALKGVQISNNVITGDYNFTGTTLSTPLSVAAGQSVSVSVTLSFS